jgi:hypothetical protein
VPGRRPGRLDATLGPVLKRRTFLLAVAVTVLLALVAIVAGGRPLGSGRGGHGGLPLSFWDYVYTTLVILAVPLLLGGVLAAMFIRRRRRKPRPLWQSMARVLVIYALLLAFEFLVLHKLQHIHVHKGTPQPETLPAPRGQQRQQHGGGTRALRFQWAEVVVILSVLALVVGAVVVLRRPRPKGENGLETAPEALAAALDESLDDLRSDADLRRAIIAAYARMESALGAAGIPRRPAEAPLEYLERALLSLSTSADSVRTLTDLFEWARFSHHDPEPSMRDEAVDALVAVRDELRASELTPA